MSDDWAVGDLALCVDAVRAKSELVVGNTYTVTGIYPHADRSMLGGIAPCGLYLAGITSSAKSGSFDPRRFRKIRPDAHEGSADDWALILETTKRRVKA